METNINHDNQKYEHKMIVYMLIISDSIQNNKKG